MLQFGASPTDDTRSVNYDRNMFIIQAPGGSMLHRCGLQLLFIYWKNTKSLKTQQPLKLEKKYAQNWFPYNFINFQVWTNWKQPNFI